MDFHVGTFQLHVHFWPNLNCALKHVMKVVSISISATRTLEITVVNAANVESEERGQVKLTAVLVT